MGEEKDSLISVYDVLGFLSDFDDLPDPPCCPIRFLADNCRLFPADELHEGKKYTRNTRKQSLSEHNE